MEEGSTGGVTKATVKLFPRLLSNSSSQAPLKLQSVTPRGSSSFTEGCCFSSKNCPGLFLAFQLLGVCNTRVLSSTFTPSKTVMSHVSMGHNLLRLLLWELVFTSSFKAGGRKKKSEHLVPSKAKQSNTTTPISWLMFYINITFSPLTHKKFTGMAVLCGMKMRMHRCFQNKIKKK